MSNIIFLCEHTIVTPGLPCLIKMAKAVSLTVERVNLMTSDSVNSFNFAMGAFASKDFPNELVLSSDGWLRTCSQTLHMIPGLSVSSIPPCNWNHHNGACVELFQAVGHFEPRFIQAHQVSRMSCNIRSLKSRIKTGSLLEEMITLSKEVFKDVASHKTVEIGKPGNPTRDNAESNDIVEQTSGS
jgi:hypothetical protein